jgi:DNA topoisomerase-1
MRLNNIWSYYVLYGGGSDKPQWSVLKHNGPLFPPPYIPHHIPVVIHNKEVILPPLAEEYATMYSRYIDTDYIVNKTFNKNFWKDFKKVLPEELSKDLSLEGIDFLLIKKHLDSEKEKKNSITKEEKEHNKAKQNEVEEPYMNCIIDGITQKVGNYRIEPPGIFIGRGNHPKLGRIKKRIMPENITLNLSKDAKVPEPNIHGHKWGKIIHDRHVIWLATWKEDITGKNKYIFTSFESMFKSKSDEDKFDLAKKLKKKVISIRMEYEKHLYDSNKRNQQLATALYLIDTMALRVGGSKDTKEQADTVGVSSLRVEHIEFLDKNKIKLDFLSKDSIRYLKTVAVHEMVYTNLKLFCDNKHKKDDIFDLVSASDINSYLNSYMEGLTAKVWRTFNASLLFQKEIDMIKEDKINSIDSNGKLNYLIAMFNQANAKVALLCNHQKAASSSLDKTLSKINTRIKELKIRREKAKSKDRIKSISERIKTLRLKKDTKKKLKNVSLGTSRDNYIDPRLIFSFIKKYSIPPEKLFTQKLLKRFEWASSVDKDYRF